MRSTLLFLVVSLVCLHLASQPLHAAPRPLPALFVTDLDGRRHDLLDPKNRATVLLFVTYDCPISNGYAPEVHRLCREYGSQQFAFYLVYSDPATSAATAKKHRMEYRYPCPGLLDKTHALVRRVGATVTPEAVILAPSGRVLYRGRIDDTYIDFGKRRDTPTTRDLRAALTALVQGKPVPVPVTKAVGCYIPGAK